MRFEDFAVAQLRPSLRLATALTGDPDLAQDLVHDVLIRLHDNWTRVRNADHPEAYLRRMLINEHARWHRRRGRRHTVAVPEFDARLVAVVADPAGAVADRDEMTRLLSTLPRKQQVVLALRYLFDLADADIAEVMNISASTVRGYAFRALNTLRAAQPMLREGRAP